MTKLELLLVNPPKYNGFSVTREERCEEVTRYLVLMPATLLLLASALRKQGHHVELVDANAFNLGIEELTKKFDNKKFDCVLFPFNSYVIWQDMKICGIAKKSNQSCKTISFSFYSRVIAKELLSNYEELDIQIVGSPFSVVPRLIKCFADNDNVETVRGIAYRKNNHEIVVNNTIKEKALADFPLPAYDLLPSFKPYYIIDPHLTPVALVISGIGCPFSCNFCNYAQTGYETRPIYSIIDELRLLKRLGNLKYVWFYDASFTVNRKRATAICEAIIKEGLHFKWFCDSRVDSVDQELLTLMRKSGCIGISYGVESGCQRILDAMGKGCTIEQARKALIWTRKARIMVQMNMIIGYPGENVTSLNESKAFIKEILPENLQIATLQVVPGTALFRETALNHEKAEKNDLAPCFKYRESKQLNDEITRMKRILLFNPKWWLLSARSLSLNPELVLPLLGTYARGFSEKAFSYFYQSSLGMALERTQFTLTREEAVV
ncbi:MAG: radical SAM protein [Candidatus Bathyarchaeota archaeon]|nr:radical SAM protein [Candidatus Bathyarchaeota archaeon]